MDEAYLNQYLEVKFVNKEPAPKGVSFIKLKEFFEIITGSRKTLSVAF
ncbi:MAG: hypothetical protein ACFFDK_19115 [Promethearchaeota archaeon]